MSYGLPTDCRILADELEHKMREACDLLRAAAARLEAIEKQTAKTTRRRPAKRKRGR